MQAPKGVTIDTSEQGTEEWRIARLGKFTASRAGDIMRRQKNGKPYADRLNYITEVALERITQELPEFVESAAMREGKERERTAALAYSFNTGNETEQSGFWFKENVGASPDDLIVGQNGGVEYKNPKAATHYATLKSQEVPEHYYWQILQNMLITGADYWDYVSYHPKFPGDSSLFIKRIKREDVSDNLELLEEELYKAEKEVLEIIKQIESYRS